MPHPTHDQVTFLNCAAHAAATGLPIGQPGGRSRPFMVDARAPNQPVPGRRWCGDDEVAHWSAPVSSKVTAGW